MAVNGGNDLNFEHLSPGYLGLANADGTLASQFYGDLIPRMRTEISDGHWLLPQRVPVPGFFEELEENETAAFRTGLAEARAVIAEGFASADSISFCNAIDLAARFGMLDEVAKLEAPFGPDDPNFYLVAHKLETYRDARRRAAGEPVDLSRLAQLAKACPHDLVRGLMIARLFVVSARYDRSRRQEELEAMHGEAIAIAERARPEGALERIWTSMIYRALPMARWTPPERARDWMTKAIEHAERVEPSLIRDELLFTTYLSVEKMRLAQADVPGAEEALHKAIALDPVDSIGHCELGMLLHRHGRVAEALPAFERAFALGPPSFAMTAYFAADCLLTLGRASEAKRYLLASAEADPFGISPRLKLLEVGEPTEVREIARAILATPALRDQLEPDELLRVQNV